MTLYRSRPLLVETGISSKGVKLYQGKLGSLKFTAVKTEGVRSFKDSQ